MRTHTLGVAGSIFQWILEIIGCLILFYMRVTVCCYQTIFRSTKGIHKIFTKEEVILVSMGGGCQIINLPRFLSTDNNVYWKFGLVLHIFMQFWKACPWLCSGLGAFIACYCRGGWALACPRPSPARFPKWFDFYMTHNSNYENKTNNNHRRIKLNSEKFCCKKSFKIFQLCGRYPSMVCVCPCGAQSCFFGNEFSNGLGIPYIRLALWTGIDRGWFSYRGQGWVLLLGLGSGTRSGISIR